MKMLVSLVKHFRAMSHPFQIDTADQSDRKQYILITPQDMGSVKIMPNMKINRMADPVRGQGVLAFS
jgi:hypothetical protein